MSPCKSQMHSIIKAKKTNKHILNRLQTKDFMPVKNHCSSSKPNRCPLPGLIDYTCLSRMVTWNEKKAKNKSLTPIVSLI